MYPMSEPEFKYHISPEAYTPEFLNMKLPSLPTFISLRSIIHRALTSNSCTIHSTLGVREHTSKSYKTTGKLIPCYITMIWKVQKNNNSSWTE